MTDKKSSTEVQELRRRLHILVEWLEAIRDFPNKGSTRDFPSNGSTLKANDGYPSEATYSEFVYRRMVDTYRIAARTALREAGISTKLD